MLCDVLTGTCVRRVVQFHKPWMNTKMATSATQHTADIATRLSLHTLNLMPICPQW